MKNVKNLLLLALMFPFLGATCAEEKLVSLSLGFPTTARFVAEGEINQHNDTDIVDVKAEIDLAAELENADVDPNDLDPDAIKVVQIFYRVIQPDPTPNRTIENGSLEVVAVDASDNPIGAPAVLVSGFSAPAGTGNVGDPTAWIDITNLIGAGGLALLNGFLEDCVTELQGGPAPANTSFQYTVTGDSAPGNVETNFQWEIKIVFQGTVQKEFEVPFG